VARILAIEDEPDVLEALRYNLAQAGHAVSATGRGHEGLERARIERPDAVLLDLVLPDVSGLDVCKSLKSDPSTSRIAVVFVSARGDEEDRVAGFEVGADDYVVKPFSLRELMLRVEAVLRRRDQPTSTQLRFGGLRIDRDAHRAWVDDRPIDLTPLEFKLLVALCAMGGGVLQRSDLLRDVWSVEADDHSRTIDQHVKRLRAKLGETARFVETVRGVGYRFVYRP
jgi:two-component system phosphate regulon response regulator PhoB